jgi:hypothetical protein
MLAPGTRIDPYEVAALIGEGGMGVVYQPSRHGRLAAVLRPCDRGALPA